MVSGRYFNIRLKTPKSWFLSSYNFLTSFILLFPYRSLRPKSTWLSCFPFWWVSRHQAFVGWNWMFLCQANNTTDKVSTGLKGEKSHSLNSFPNYLFILFYLRGEGSMIWLPPKLIRVFIYKSIALNYTSPDVRSRVPSSVKFQRFKAVNWLL